MTYKITETEPDVFLLHQAVAAGTTASYWCAVGSYPSFQEAESEMLRRIRAAGFTQTSTYFNAHGEKLGA